MPAFCEGAGLPPLRTTGSIRVIRERKRVYGPNQTRIQHSTSVWNPAPEVLSASEHRAIGPSSSTLFDTPGLGAWPACNHGSCGGPAMRHYWSAQAYMRAWLRDQLDHRRVQRVRRIGGAVLTTAQSLAVASQFGVSLAVGVGLGLIAGQWAAGRSGPYGPPVHAARSLRRTHPWHAQRRCVVSSNPAF